jgi:hypothetical protein
LTEVQSQPTEIKEESQKEASADQSEQNETYEQQVEQKPA